MSQFGGLINEGLIPDNPFHVETIMACEKKWAVFAVFVSVIVVVAIVVPIAVFRNTGQSNGQLTSQDGGSMAPNEMFLQFAAMIQCTTKTNPLNYQGYGCHCGLFNGGGAIDPVDAADQCCKDHDTCLRGLESSGVCEKHAFFTIYSTKMKGCGKKKKASVTCKTQDQYSPVERMAALGKVACAEALCRCDRDAAICFSKHPLQRRFKMGNKDSSVCVATGGPGTEPGTGPTTSPPTTKPVVQTTVLNPPAQGTGGPAPIYRIA